MARKPIKVTGLDKVVAGLNRELKKIQGKTTAGLLEAALLIRGESQRLTPVDTGNLRASPYIVWGGGKVKTRAKADVPSFNIGDKSGQRVATEHGTKIEERKNVTKGKVQPFAEIGYTAFYAPIVHEAPAGTRFKVGQSKFLEQALVNNSKRVFAIIKRRAKIL